jgi:ribonuclease-3
VSLPPETIDSAQKILGRRFQNTALLQEALTHASIADSRLASNERLEFLGDSVLGLIVCERLFEKYPALLEGDMTKIKSVAVSRKICAKVAIELGLVDLLLLGKGMQTSAGLPSSLAAALLESVIGAVYLDGGIQAARDFVLPLVDPIIRQAAESGHQQNFKSVLQQVAQDRFGLSPAYVLLDEKGPDHAKCFEVCVQIGAQRFASTWGQSKKQAEQQAALLALDELGAIATDERGELMYVAGAGANGQAKHEDADGPEDGGHIAAK